MSTTTKKSAFVFGGNISTLISALYLQRQGYAVTLFDSANSFSAESPRFLSTDFTFWPDSARTQEALALLEQTLGLAIPREAVELTPKLVSAEKVTDFLGFGDKKYSSLPAISNLNIRAHLQLDMTNEAMCLRALEQFDGEIKAYSMISNINFTADGIENIQINGGKDLNADLYVFTQTPKDLLDMLPEEVITPRTRSKIARTEVFGRLSLKTTEAFDAQAVSDLMGSLLFLIPHAADFEPCVGTIQDDATSWHAYINSEFGEDPEKVAGQVRHMRKIIEKAVPTLQAPLKTATISFEQQDYAAYESAQIIPNILKSNRNIMVTSGLWSQLPGLAGCVEALLLNTEVMAELSADGTQQTAESTDAPTSLDAQV